MMSTHRYLPLFPADAPDRRPGVMTVAPSSVPEEAAIAPSAARPTVNSRSDVTAGGNVTHDSFAEEEVQMSAALQYQSFAGRHLSLAGAAPRLDAGDAGDTGDVGA